MQNFQRNIMTILKNIIISSAVLVSLNGVSNIVFAQDSKAPVAINAAKADGTPAKIGDLSADGNYVFKGDGIGWELAPHKKALKNGKLVHVDKLSHDTAPPVTATTKIGDYSADGLYVYKGGDSGWQLAQHKKVLKDGKWVHTDKIPKNTATPPAPTATQIAQDRQKNTGQ
jgi:hypothetical protein